MAKIENTIVYPTVTPAASDLLIATDVSNNNKTVTFLVSSISGGGVLQDLQSVLTTGDTAIENINLTGNINVIGTVYPSTITASGSIGTAGQILSSTGSGIMWINAAGGASCCSWDDSLIAGNVALTDSVIDGVGMVVQNVGGSIRLKPNTVFASQGTSVFEGSTGIFGHNLKFDAGAGIQDSFGSSGLAGQFLTSTGANQIQWSSIIPPSACCPLQSTLGIGNIANDVGITFTGLSTTSFGVSNSILSQGNNTWSGENIFSGAVTLSSTLSDGVTVGTSGQVLSSTGAGVKWITPTVLTNTLQQVLDTGNSATGVNANITISGSFSSAFILDTSGGPGTPGQILQSNGGTYSWVDDLCCSLDQVLTVGNTSSQSIILQGTATIKAPTMVPGEILTPTGSTGVNGQFLGIVGGVLDWTTPSLVDTTYTYTVPSGSTSLSLGASSGGVQDITLTPGAGITIVRNSLSQLTFENIGIISVSVGATPFSTGLPLIANVVNGALVLQNTIFNGGTDVGVVPSSGGGSTDFLRADGLWAPPSGGGVTQISLGANVISTGNPLAINTVGTVTTITPQRYGGAALEGFVPTGGTNVTFLRGDGQWVTPSGGGGGVNTLTLNTTTGQSVPLTGSIVGSVLTLSSNVFGGTADVGYVPGSSGGTTEFLRADGNWAVPPSAGGGVTGVQLAVSSGSTNPLSAAISSSTLTIVSNRFTGSNRVGYVPASSGGTTDFLRADGTWGAPVGSISAGSFATDFSFFGYNIDMASAGGYYSYNNMSAANWPTWPEMVQFTQALSPITGTWTAIDLLAATVYNNGLIGSSVYPCDPTSKISTLCVANLTIIGDSSTVNVDYTLELWKYTACDPAVPVRIYVCDVVTKGPLVAVCKKFSAIINVPATFEANEALFFTIRQTGVGQQNLQAKVDLRFTYS